METLYADEIITIGHHPNINTLQGSWNNCETTEQYLSGMTHFKAAYYKIKPKNTFWDNRDFNFQLNEGLQTWTNSFFYNQVTKDGFNGKVGILMGNEILSSISIDNLFNNGRYELKLRFFKDPQIALDWFSKPFSKLDIHHLPEISFKEQNGKIQCLFEMATEEFHDYFLLLKQLFKNRNFSIQNTEKFYSLTNREREVLKLAIHGKTNFEIADGLFVSVETVKTHRKNILAKLDYRNVRELTNFEVFF